MGSQVPEFWAGRPDKQLTLLGLGFSGDLLSAQESNNTLFLYNLFAYFSISMKQLESKKCKFTKIIGTISQPFLLLCRLREFFSPLVLHPPGYSKTYYKFVQNGFTPQFCFWKNGRTFLLFLLTCDAPYMVPNMTFPLCFAEGQEVPLHRRGDPIHCCSSVAKPCLTLCVPMCYRPPGSSVHGILQARILEWAAISSSRGIFPTQVSCLPGRFFTTEPPGKPLSTQSYPLLLALFQDLAGKWQASLVLTH